jgi:hypothetical protein
MTGQYAAFARGSIDGNSYRPQPNRSYEEVKGRAHDLLMRFLTPEQAEQYRKTLYFNIIGADGRTYRLGFPMKVDLFDGESLAERWCACIPNAPREDTIVAQLLLLKSDPESLRRMANVTLHDAPLPPPKDIECQHV